jgi:hypothetical protein
LQVDNKVSTTFCEQKVAKKLYSPGPWAAAPSRPTAQSHKVFGAGIDKRVFVSRFADVL